jgi:hydrogenase maturation protease
VIVLGVGNEWRRDDGAGPACARLLADRLPPDVEVATAAGETTEVLTLLEGREQAIVIDAVSSPAPPGTIHRIDVHSDPLPAAFSRLSSHGFGLAEAIELARALGKLPARVTVYGIEGEDFGDGEGLTPAVLRAVQRVAGDVAILIPWRSRPARP